MNAARPRLLKVLIAMALSVGSLIAMSAPAQALTWYVYDAEHAGCGTFFTDYCAVEYTGGYPNGLVRGHSYQNVYQVILQTRGSHSAPWVTVATHSAPTTSAVKTTRNGTFRTCIKQLSASSSLICGAPAYLGD